MCLMGGISVLKYECVDVITLPLPLSVFTYTL